MQTVPLLLVAGFEPGLTRLNPLLLEGAQVHILEALHTGSELLGLEHVFPL
jgi:hypothetical protein